MNNNRRALFDSALLIAASTAVAYCYGRILWAASLSDRLASKAYAGVPTPEDYLLVGGVSLIAPVLVLSAAVVAIRVWWPSLWQRIRSFHDSLPIRFWLIVAAVVIVVLSGSASAHAKYLAVSAEPAPRVQDPQLRSGNPVDVQELHFLGRSEGFFVLQRRDVVVLIHEDEVVSLAIQSNEAAQSP